jgi:hypothetical protein
MRLYPGSIDYRVELVDDLCGRVLGRADPIIVIGSAPKSTSRAFILGSARRVRKPTHAISPLSVTPPN